MTNILNIISLSDVSILTLVNNSNELDDESKIRDFFQLWPRVDKFATDILIYLSQSTLNGQTILSKPE